MQGKKLTFDDIRWSLQNMFAEEDKIYLSTYVKKGANKGKKRLKAQANESDQGFEEKTKMEPSLIAARKVLAGDAVRATETRYGTPAMAYCDPVFEDILKQYMYPDANLRGYQEINKIDDQMYLEYMKQNPDYDEVFGDMNEKNKKKRKHFG